MQKTVYCTLVFVILVMNACKDPISTIDQRNVRSNRGIVVFDTSSGGAGDVAVGTTSNFAVSFSDIDLANGANITAMTITGADAAMFKVTNPHVMPIHLPPNSGLVMSISFSPTRVGHAGARLTFTVYTAAGISYIGDSLSGNGYTGSLCFNVPRLDFGTFYHSSRPGPDSPAVAGLGIPVTVTNCSAYTVDISNTRGTYGRTSAVDDDSTEIDLVSGSTTMAPGASVTLRVWMRPKLLGPNQGTLTITSPQLQTPATLPLLINGDLQGFPAANWDTLFVAQSTAPGATTKFSAWFHNTLAFPITLKQAGGGGDKYNWWIDSDVDYNAAPVVINAGDSLPVSFTLTPGLATPSTINTFLTFGFAEVSYVFKPLKAVR